MQQVQAQIAAAAAATNPEPRTRNPDPGPQGESENLDVDCASCKKKMTFIRSTQQIVLVDSRPKRPRRWWAGPARRAPPVMRHACSLLPLLPLWVATRAWRQS